MNTLDYLAAISAQNNNCSDYKLAKLLGTRQQTVSKWRNGETYFSDAFCVKVARMLNIDPVEVLADIAAERSNDPEVTKLWERVSRMAHSAAAVFIFGFVAVMGLQFGGDILAAGPVLDLVSYGAATTLPADFSVPTLSIMLSTIALLLFLLAALSDAVSPLFRPR